jgi:hypothetical protein
VKRKQLQQYLPPSLLKRERKSSVSGSTSGTSTSGVKRRADGTPVSDKKKRICDSSVRIFQNLRTTDGQFDINLQLQADDTTLCNDDSNSSMSVDVPQNPTCNDSMQANHIMEADSEINLENQTLGVDTCQPVGLT